MFQGLVCIISLLALVGCQEGTPLKEPDKNPVHQTKTHLGQRYLDYINNADEVRLSKVKSVPYAGYEFEPTSVNLEQNDVNRLKSILLNDRSYLFDVKKKCVFIPEYALEFFVKEQKLMILYAPLCKEFKIPYGQFKAQIIEIDPSFEKIEELLEKYKQQLEVNDGNNSSING